MTGTSRTYLPPTLLTLVVAVLLLGCWPAPASAYVVHPFLFKFGPNGTSTSSFVRNRLIAVDQGSHDVYVQDARVLEPGKALVYRFAADGTIDKFTAGPGAGTNKLPGLTFETQETIGSQIGELAVAPPGAPGGTAGDLYVNEATVGVKVFASSGEQIGSLDGSGNPNPDSGGVACGVATDNAGNVYVSYDTHIDKYVPSGHPVKNADFDSEITGVGACTIAAGAQKLYAVDQHHRFENGGPQDRRVYAYPLSLFPGGDGSLEASGAGTKLSEVITDPYAVAVEPISEDVYVAGGSSTGTKVAQYDKEGNVISKIKASDGAWGVAADSTSGNLYVSNQFGGTAANPSSQIYAFGPGVPVAPPTATLATVSSLTYKSADFAGTVNSGGSGENQATTYRFECSPACPGLQGDRQVPADGEDHEVTDEAEGLSEETEYTLTLVASNLAGTAKDTLTFKTPAKPIATAPGVTIDPVTVLDDVSAHLTGTVDPAGFGENQATTYRFEWSPDGSQWFRLKEQGPIEGIGPQQVSDDLEGLEANTAYHVRLTAENTGGTATQAETFTTAAGPPEAEATGASQVLSTSAQLNARIDPRNSATSYYFQWGEGDCAQSACASVPASQDAEAGSGGDSVFVAQPIEGLAPGTGYSYRVVAVSAGGETASPSVSFETPPAASACPNQGLRTGQSAALPDCRAYEMVSPLDKSGADIGTNPARSRVSFDGDAVSYMAISAFGDAVGVDDSGTEYVSRRGPEAWETHGISPEHVAPPVPSINGKSLYVGDFTPDLSKGVFLALTDVPGVTSSNVTGVSNLYLGEGLGSAGRSFALLSDSTAPLPADREGLNTGYTPEIELDGASADLSLIAFETSHNLTPEASGITSKVYEWEDGTVRLASILPDDACASPPCPAADAVAGAGAITKINGDEFDSFGTYTEASNVVSEDGKRVFFTVGPFTKESGNPALNGDLYMRENGASTVRIDAGERAGESDPAGTSRFQWATPDGEKVFFLSTGALVEADQDGSGRDLYEYDVAAPEGHRLRLLTPETLTPSALGITHVVGVSRDGAFVYFLGAPGNGENNFLQHLYLLHGRTVRTIGAREFQRPAWGETGTVYGGSKLRVSDDGRHVLFQSFNDQGLGYDNHGDNCPLDSRWEEQNVTAEIDVDRCAELYLYSYASDETVCVSCNPTGAPPAGNASFGAEANSRTFSLQTLSQPMSDDGRRVFFDSRDALVAGDSNGKVDVYEYDSETGKLALISSGQCNCDSLFVAASPSGDDVFFTTLEQLVLSDTDNLFDLYDARVGGGIAGQNSLPQPGCEGDGCQPQPNPPAPVAPASAAYQGPGNQVQPHPPRKCKRRAAKCKRHHHTKRRHHHKRRQHGHGGAAR